MGKIKKLVKFAMKTSIIETVIHPHSSFWSAHDGPDVIFTGSGTESETACDIPSLSASAVACTLPALTCESHAKTYDLHKYKGVKNPSDGTVGQSNFFGLFT